MHQLLEELLDDMKAEEVHLPDLDGGGARENLWTFSFHRDDLPDAAALALFLERAVAVRRAQVALLRVKPATFYFWHDAQAGHLCLSVALCTKNTLPFAAALSLDATPHAIIQAFLSQPVPDGCDAPEPPALAKQLLKVWAQELN